jgi:hypothetical protein
LPGLCLNSDIGVFGDQHAYRINGRPTAQWAHIKAGRSYDLSVGA